ncbi:abasic site processing protein HMCES [Phlebotomus papatasi]|uniref:abasic site processing protein HMCES n=1 Tax=Phlebotomus papatasi TaxID=29031 RepID=UPI0024843049|nr:abasic site processing protein HMCES [Phlebotomus papatasi]
MCGRTCLTLAPEDVCRACKYKASKGANGKKAEPEWRSEYNLGKSYNPSYNIAPTDITPVLISEAHFEDEEEGKASGEKRVLVPMMWGIVPFWHKGQYNTHGLTTNNCRLENLMNSRLYKRSFMNGQRCVIVCEGFYEWQTTKKAKSSERDVFFIYSPQAEGIKIEDKATWEPEDVDLLKMAGIYDVWTSESGDTLYSYTIITFQSNKKLSWMHDRMPAILDTEEKVADWLDFKRVKPEDALKLLKPTEKITWHQVSKIVNNSRNKSDQCNKPIKGEKRGSSPIKSKMMQAWLGKPQNSKPSKDEESDPGSEKKPKLEIKEEEPPTSD